MPHISRYKLNGKLIPSVNTISDSLSKDGLIRNFYRKHGFEEADKIGAAARDNGVELATAFEEYRKTGKYNKRNSLVAKCIENWTHWFERSPFYIEHDMYVEPHLVSKQYGYHGSPDLILETAGTYVLGDDKLKKRFSDYKLLMNEHAYAMADHIEIDGQLRPVKWEIPIKTFWFFTYNPENGNLHAVEHDFDPDIFKDFLVCKDMYEINKRAEAYFAKHATLLPTA